jgi:hypothetical protein
VCHHGHRVHPVDRRHHRDGRRNRRHHRDGRRNRHHHRERHRDDRERHHERDAHRDDRPWPDRASCPGSDAERRDGGHRRRQEPDGHPADEAFPGLARRGCCPDEQPTVRRGLRAARGPHGHLVACPGSGRRGCCRAGGLQVAARGAGHRPHLHVPPVPQGQASWLRGPSGPEPWELEPWGPGPGPWGPEPSGRASPRGLERASRPPLHGPGPEPPESWAPQERLRRPPLWEQRVLRARVPRGQVWLPMPWRLALRGRPCRSWPMRQQPARPGTTREPCGRQAVRWSRKPTGRTRPVLSDG